jgi:hypothetical protein
MKLHLLWLFLPLAAAGCGSYEVGVSGRPASRDGRNLIKVAGDLRVCLGEYQRLLDGIKTPDDGRAAIPKARELSAKLSALAVECVQAERAASPQDLDKFGTEYKPQAKSAGDQLNNTAHALLIIPNMPPELVTAVFDGTRSLATTGTNEELVRVSAAASGTSAWAMGGILLVIVVACVAFLHTESLWSNALRLINVVTAALLATNFFEPAADWLTERMPSYIFLWDFLTIWGLFVLFVLVFREITDRISRVDVRFLKLADRIGSGLLAAWIGWVMVCFSLTTLHTAPLGTTFLFGTFQPMGKMFFGVLAPDREWLAFTRKTSLGTYCRSGEEGEYMFDPDSRFIALHAARRWWLEKHVSSTGALRVNPDAAQAPAPP